MSLKIEILNLFITTDEFGNRYYPSGYKDIIIKAGELVDAREKELIAQIEQFVPHGYLAPNGDMTSMNFDGCKRLYVNKYAIAPPEGHGCVPDAHELANRFMGWKLPDDFAPDCGISFKRQADYVHPKFGAQIYKPIGTNLLTLAQAEAMFEWVLAQPQSQRIRNE